MDIKKSYTLLLVLQIVIFLQSIIYIPFILLGIKDIFILSTISSIIVFTIPIIFYIKNNKQDNILSSLNLNKISLRHFIFTIVCTILFMPISSLLSGIGGLFFNNNVADSLFIVYDLPSWQLLVMIAITPAIFEEIIMRGLFLSNFKGISIHKVAIINGFFFCLIHQDLQQLLYTFVFGIYFAYLTYYTGTVLAPILSHFVFNATPVLFIAYYKATDPTVFENAYESVYHVTISELYATAAIPIILATISLIIFYFNFVKKPNKLYEVDNMKVTVDSNKLLFNKLFYINFMVYLIIILIKYVL